MIHNATGYELATDTVDVPDQVMVVYAHLLDCAIRMEHALEKDMNAMRKAAGETTSDAEKCAVWAAYRRVYINPPDPGSREKVWIVGDNFEQLSWTLIYDKFTMPGQWYERLKHDGSDRAITFEEAKAAAAIAYTG